MQEHVDALRDCRVRPKYRKHLQTVKPTRFASQEFLQRLWKIQCLIGMEVVFFPLSFKSRAAYKLSASVANRGGRQVFEE